MAHFDSLYLLYWNCRGALEKKAEIENMAHFDVIFLAETCIKENRDFLFFDFEHLLL